MKKLRLEPDELRIETFATAALPADGRGTVHARGCCPYCCCCPCRCTCCCTCETCAGQWTCDYSCNDTCGATCYDSCTCPTEVRCGPDITMPN